MRLLISIFFTIFTFSYSFSQEKNELRTIEIKLKFGEQDLQLDTLYISKLNDTLSFDVIKFYLSSFEFHYTDASTFKEKYSYHLIDIEHPESLNIPFENHSKKNIESISFNIGVDSLASVSGAMNGNLDATKGMYWAWQSGFINMKIEGKSNSCKTRKNQFQFHIGGYLEPNYTMRTVELQIPNVTFELVVDLAKLFSEIKLNETNSIMIPGKEAMNLADLCIDIFSVK